MSHTLVRTFHTGFSSVLLPAKFDGRPRIRARIRIRERRVFREQRWGSGDALVYARGNPSPSFGLVAHHTDATSVAVLAVNYCVTARGNNYGGNHYGCPDQ